MRKKNCTALYPFLFLGIFFGSCNQPQAVSFTGYRNLHFSMRGFSTGMIKMDLALYNPNSFGMKIKEMSLQVLVNQKPFGEITQDSLCLMPPKDTFLMPVSFKVHIMGLLQNSISFSQKDSVLLEANGSCMVGKGGMFFKMPLHYKSKEIFKLF